MPKIIKNLEENIFQMATELFCLKGYDAVDMKAIAKACNIAVGTLYNYFPNKKRLYIDIVKHSWEKTFVKLYNINFSDDKDKGLKDIIEILYDEVCKRKGIGKDIKKLSEKGDKEFIELEQYIFNGFRRLSKYFEKKHSFSAYQDIDLKIIYLLFSNLVLLIGTFPDNKEENINILYETIKVYFVM